MCLLFVLLGQVPFSTAQAQQGRPTLAQVKALFPGYTSLTEEDLGRFKSLQVDLNGDGKKELIVVENPNQKKKKVVVKKGAQCPCPPPKRVSKRAKRIKRYLQRYKKAIHSVQVVRKGRRSRHVKIWFFASKAKTQKTLPKWALTASVRLGRYYRYLRQQRVTRIYFINMDDGKTLYLSPYRAYQLRRQRKRRRLSRFRRWRRKTKDTTIPMCACPKPKKKKKTRRKLPGATKPLNIVFATKEAPKLPTTPPDTRKPAAKPAVVSADALLASYKVFGRLRGQNVQFTGLTQDGRIIGIRVEQTIQVTPRAPRVTTERLYVYDEGNTGRLKQVFQIKTSREGDDNEPGARQWVNLTFKQMDADAWLEIVADAYYETPRFNGLLARRMYKWYQGKFVSLNQYRGILRTTTNSTWTNIANSGSRILRKRLQMRTNANNVVDGFRNTPWFAGRLKRGVGSWVRIQMTRTMPLLGLAIAAYPPKLYTPIVPSLFRGRAPKIIPPRFVRIQTASGYNQTSALRVGAGFTVVRFPTPIQTRFIKVSIVAEHRNKSRQVSRLKIPPKERSISMISEIIPLFRQIRYTASSFDLKGTGSTLPALAGDNRSVTAWAEGRSDDGVGEWLQMVFPMPRQLSQLNIVNGCRRPGEAYILNNRIKEAELTFSNGSTQTITLKDTHKTQKIRVRPVRTMSVKLTIRSVYKGKIGKTTCIAEFRP